jgi:hypothetical protein
VTSRIPSSASARSGSGSRSDRESEARSQREGAHHGAPSRCGTFPRRSRSACSPQPLEQLPCGSTLPRESRWSPHEDFAKNRTRLVAVSALLIRKPQVQSRLVEVGITFEPGNRLGRSRLLHQQYSDSVRRIGMCVISVEGAPVRGFGAAGIAQFTPCIPEIRPVRRIRGIGIPTPYPAQAGRYGCRGWDKIPNLWT